MKIDIGHFKDKVQEIIEAQGFELADMASPMVGGRTTLRAFIYSPKGVTLDDCATISRAISDWLDSEDIIQSRYTLEVSSLGLDRPLVTPRDFMRRIGERVRVTYKLDQVEKTIEGLLINSDEQITKIDTGDDVITIPAGASPRGKIIIK